MAPKERVSRYTHLQIMIPPIVWKIGDHLYTVLRYPPFKKTPQASKLPEVLRYPLLGIAALKSYEVKI
ncbi:hypothetical protein J1N35_011465 [Gossypium stocksii]|uniref:Uncharacterized protein n=1 Tax=Gossypium stocksii TaxID=47602 RepID=A0A9D4ABH9_9ROSI|nr:hypothetical protein J1N35_011465 [Gossypium stocksii]